MIKQEQGSITMVIELALVLVQCLNILFLSSELNNV